MKMKTTAAVMAIALMAGSIQAQVISVNWHQKDGGPEQKIEGSETFGVEALGTVVGGWNNTSWKPWNIKWNDGSASMLEMEVDLPSGKIGNNGQLADTPMELAVMHYDETPAGRPNFTVSGLKEDFPKGCKVIVYLTSRSEGWARQSTGSISDGTTTYYFKPSGSPELVQATATKEADAVVASYAVFDNITSDSITIALGPDGAGSGVGFGGFQIVGIE